MDEQQVREMLDALRAENTRRIAEAAGEGDSAEVQKLSAVYTSLDVIASRWEASDCGTG